MIFVKSLFAPENVLPFKKYTLEVDTFSLSSIIREKKNKERKKIFFFTAFLCFLEAHPINYSVKRKSKGLNSIKNCSDYAMQFCSCCFITICRSSGPCCASSSRGEKAPSTAEGHFLPERRWSYSRARHMSDF